MSQVFKMPLVNTPQRFQISLSGVDYIMTCKWNDSPDAGWVLDFSNANTNESIVANIPLITGANLLEGLGYLGFNGSFYVFTDGNDTAVPTLENLGVESNLYFVTEDSSG